MIKFLDLKEKLETRKIWEEIFLEDSKKFLDYYYTEKIKDNYILANFFENKLVSMLHLNPFNLYINNNILKSYYIVAVATLKEHRKKGYMQSILNYSINFMNERKIPFCFLRPAKEEIYLPFDFKYIYNHNTLNLKGNSNIKEKKILESDYNLLANFINSYLKEKYNVFAVRDYNYIKTLHKEVISENGDIILLYENDNFIGCYIYWGNEKTIRAIFTEEKYYNILNKKPLVMGRIINLHSFFENITSREEINLKLKIEDKIIKENNAIFNFNIKNEKTTITKIENYEESDLLKISISNLTSLFFGYEDIKMFTKNEKIIKIFKNINFYKPFLDEEV